MSIFRKNTDIRCCILQMFWKAEDAAIIIQKTYTNLVDVQIMVSRNVNLEIDLDLMLH